jgi:predicted transcriptional regulator
MTKHPKPTDAELGILRVLWNRGPSTVRQVQDELSKNKKTGYTTVLKFMQIMVDKGLLRRDDSPYAHIYEARVPREQTQRSIVADIVDRVFEGSMSRLVMQALEAKHATSEELAEIRKVLKKYERGEQ